jgi:pimeloyl-ACP methyl ester carboxylesterase
MRASGTAFTSTLGGRKMKKKAKSIILSAGVIICALAAAFIIYINTGPCIPGGDTVFEEIMTCELPELVTGQTGFARNGTVKIWYEAFNPAGSPKGTILLIMGHSATALRWQDFHLPFVKAGYRVIRFDNRGVGLSDWITDWDKNKPYLLEDMALDSLAVMDALKVGRAHLVGVSMGGMIAQEMAIRHQSRVASLTSIMSTGFLKDPELTILPGDIMEKMIKISLRYLLVPTKMNQVKFQTYVFYLVNNNVSFDTRKSALVARYELERHGGYNPGVKDQHDAAILASGSRYDRLGSIKAPALVIHGKADPLIPVEHAMKYAAMIPHARTLFVDGMGHYIPKMHAEQIQQAILQTIQSK